MNTDKAYLLGIIIGGGIFGNAEDVFRIKLPYNKWGSYIENPQRAGQIARDILMKVGQMFRAVYNLSIQYETTPKGTWTILCEGDTTALKEDFAHYGIECEGELRGKADITLLIQDLVDVNLKRRFIAGIADTIGSMAKTHRRFTDEHQIISFEIKGFNYKFVCNLCHLLYSINCIPDQVIWNHPNIHSTKNPFYDTWCKGFKLRILLDQYAQFGAFAFRTKAETSIENRALQHQTHKAEICETRSMNISPSTIHKGENDARLPEIIKGGHYLHNRHFCAVLGCEHAPYDKICECFARVGEYINPFPILCKETTQRIEKIINETTLYSERNYETFNLHVSELLSIYENNKSTLMYGNNNSCGYPILEILQGVAYVIANNDELNGTRIKGNYIDLINKHILSNGTLTVEIKRPDLLTPLIIKGIDRSALVGPVNPRVYSRLVSFSSENAYKMVVRPITLEDLQND